MDIPRTATALGDPLAASAVAMVVFAWCWRYRGRIMALVFAMGFGAVVIATALLKMLSFEAFLNPGVTDPWRLSDGAPSGHAALATVVYGSASLLFATGGQGLTSVCGALLSLAALAAVLVTRVTLHAHTIADVVAGLALSGLFVLLFDQVRRRRAHGPGGGAVYLLAGMAGAATIALLSRVPLHSALLG
jgi:undecaprenyl-diphosphatase